MGRRFARKLFVSLASIAVALTFVGGAYALSGSSSSDETPSETPTVESTASETPTPEATETEEAEPTPTPDASPTPDADENESEAEDDGDDHGVERIHEGCGSSDELEGNWNHGDYVNAAGDDHEARHAAAKSDCGKPNKGRRASGGGEDSHGKKKGHDANEGRGSGGHDDESDDQGDD